MCSHKSYDILKYWQPLFILEKKNSSCVPYEQANRFREDIPEKRISTQSPALSADTQIWNIAVEYLCENEQVRETVWSFKQNKWSKISWHCPFKFWPWGPAWGRTSPSGWMPRSRRRWCRRRWGSRGWLCWCLAPGHRSPAGSESWGSMRVN